MRIKEVLKEAFNTFYPIRRIGKDEFEFTTDSENTYEINFFRPTHPLMFTQLQSKKLSVSIPPLTSVCEVDFMLKGTPSGEQGYKFSGVSNVQDDAMKIFATVLNTTFWYVENNTIDALFFSGEGALGALYQRMVRRFIPPNFDVVAKKVGSGTSFMIYRKTAFREA